MATETLSPNIAKIHLTERAALKIRALLEKDGVSPEQGGLRVGVQGGGCSGLSYAMRLDTQARDRDKIFEEHGARVFVDPKSLLYLNGTTLEYEETLMRTASHFFCFSRPLRTPRAGEMGLFYDRSIDNDAKATRLLRTVRSAAQAMDRDVCVREKIPGAKLEAASR
jgi:iron-sulfur cluster assembly protein